MFGKKEIRIEKGMVFAAGHFDYDRWLHCHGNHPCPDSYQ